MSFGNRLAQAQKIPDLPGGDSGNPKGTVPSVVPKLAAARKLLNEGTPRKEVAEIMKISMATLYRYFPGEHG